MNRRKEAIWRPLDDDVGVALSVFELSLGDGLGGSVIGSKRFDINCFWGGKKCCVEIKCIYFKKEEESVTCAKC